MSVVIHEVAHGYMALALGDPTAKYQDRLTLNPLYHLDPVGSILVPLIGYFTGGFIIGWAKPVPYNPYNLRNRRWGEALVAIAGPLSNVALAVIFGLILRYMPQSGTFNDSFFGLIQFVVYINITLAVFNLIPIPPLDGSKILFAIFPVEWLRLRDYIERMGFWLVIIFVLFFWPHLIPVIEKLFAMLTGITF